MNYFNKRVPAGVLPDNEAANAKHRAKYWRKRLPETTQHLLLKVKKRSNNSEIAQDAVVYAHYCESDMRICAELFGTLSEHVSEAEALYAKVKESLDWMTAYCAGTDVGRYTRREGFGLLRKHRALLSTTHREFVGLIMKGVDR